MNKWLLPLILLMCAPADAQISRRGITLGVANNLFLRLDTTNDPLTGILNGTAAIFSGAVQASSMTVTGNAFSVGGSTLVVTTGFVSFATNTKASLKLMAPSAIGQMVFCSDCSVATIMISTGTAAGNFANVADRTAALGAW